MIGVQVNGKPVQLAGPTPLLDYLHELGVDARAVAVEVNGAILERGRYGACTLDDGDAIEIVRMVGGGTAAANRPGISPARLPSRPAAPPGSGRS